MEFEINKIVSCIDEIIINRDRLAAKCRADKLEVHNATVLSKVRYDLEAIKRLPEFHEKVSIPLKDEIKKKMSFLNRILYFNDYIFNLNRQGREWHIKNNLRLRAFIWQKKNNFTCSFDYKDPYECLETSPLYRESLKDKFINWLEEIYNIPYVSGVYPYFLLKSYVTIRGNSSGINVDVSKHLKDLKERCLWLAKLGIEKININDFDQKVLYNENVNGISCKDTDRHSVNEDHGYRDLLLKGIDKLVKEDPRLEDFIVYK